MEILRDTPKPVRILALVGAAIVLLHVVVFAAVQVLQRTAGGVLAGTTVLGRDVGGMDRPGLVEAVRDIRDDHAAQPVVVTAGEDEVSATRAAVGSSVDVGATVDEAWERGRGILWGALIEHIRAMLDRREEVAQIRTDDDAVRAWARRAATQLERAPRPPRVRFTAQDGSDVDVEVTDGREGMAIDDRALEQRLRAGLAERGPVEVEAPFEAIASAIDEEEVEAAVDRAREAVSAPVVLENPSRGDNLRLSRKDLASVLEVRPDRSAPGGERLTLRLSPDALADHLGPDRINVMEVAPRDARFAIVGGEVRIRGGRRGFDVAIREVSERVLELVEQERPRRGELPGERTRPEFSRQDAEDLGIEERVSSFTTEHPCCEPRVTNIHRIADMVDGVLIRPGERFEVNEHVGPRTRAKGFVPAPAIIDGEFEDAVGGGVSQFATTFFNAAFFAGIELEEFQPHSYYFDRYPMGNEATISYGAIDLAIRNDSPYGILVKTRYTETSVTVTFWSTEWAEVDIERIGPTNVQEGAERNGFDVTVRRIIEYPDGSRDVEEYFHRYQPQD